MRLRFLFWEHICVDREFEVEIFGVDELLCLETSCRKKDSAGVQTDSGVLSDSSKSGNKISSLAADPGNCARSFAFRDLAIATQNFKEANLIGEGGFGRVYKGRLDSGQVVAIKQLNRDGLQGNNEFLVEVLMLIMLRHPNLGISVEVQFSVVTATWCFQARPFLNDRRKFQQLADPFLQGRYSPRAFHQLVVIASMCLQEQPHVRPIIADVVVALNHVTSQPYITEPALLQSS
ncbi:hypothetical protein C4D60_Mb05t16290 [Musa balbisiana]|uniref:Protein kinase domain-containing protein n=1 Tax=Musa balbisiana TaxID=52838 RepID=A0A4S8JWK4_MUSBA|nr:hypothetical protein C4D60_Mb05t16290 [Musa balbisiana]